MMMPDIKSIERTLNDEASSEESKRVARWLATKEGQIWLAERMDLDEKDINLGEEDEYVDHPIPSEEIYQNILRKIRLRKSFRRILNVAAVFLPLVLFIGLLSRLDSQIDLFASNTYEEIFAPRGKRVQVIFQDGSRAYLNSESRIRYPKKFSWSERKIFLEGEAWFEVSKNKRRPFIVRVEDIDVKVLGTTFDVKAYPNDEEISVSLETGSVRLESDLIKPFELLPGDLAVYNKKSNHIQITKPNEFEKESTWKIDCLVFNDEPLENVLKTLTRTYNVDFVVKDKKAYEYSYSVETTMKDLSVVLQELEKITPVQFKRQGDIYEVFLKK